MSRHFTEPQMRPPQEAHSLLLYATQGCTYNKCAFCYVSRGYPFLSVSEEELASEVAQTKGRYPATTRIYLTGSNPFALPYERLAGYLSVLRQAYPQFERVSMQARIGDIEQKSDEELAELCRLGLSHVYVGTENGSDRVLELMNKGQTAGEIVCQLQRLDRAGITYACFYQTRRNAPSVRVGMKGAHCPLTLSRISG